MTLRKLLPVLALALPVAPASLPAQPDAGNPGLVTAAVVHLRASLDGRVRAEGSGAAAALALAAADETLRAAGVVVVPPGGTLRCPGLPASCRLLDAEALVMLTDPFVDGEWAMLVVEVRTPGVSERIGVDARWVRLELRREGGVWRVVAEVPMGMS